MTKARTLRRVLVVGVAVAMAVLAAGPAEAAGCGCGEVSAIVRSEVNGAKQQINARIDAMEQAIVEALRKHAGETSGTVQGLGSVQAGIADAQNAAAVQRDREREQISALQRYQFSEALCQTAAGTEGVAPAAVSVAANKAAAEKAAAAQANGTSGAVASLLRGEFAARVQRYCNSPTDPACDGRSGSHPNADLTPGATLLDRKTLRTAEEVANADAVIENLLGGPTPPALPAERVASAEGMEEYLRRKRAEAQFAAAREALLARRAERLPSVDGGWARAVAGAAGAPIPDGKVSQLEHDHARLVLQYQAPGYFEAIVGQEPAVAARIALTMQAQTIELLWSIREELKATRMMMAPGLARAARADMPGRTPGMVGTRSGAGGDAAPAAGARPGKG